MEMEYEACFSDPPRLPPTVVAKDIAWYREGLGDIRRLYWRARIIAALLWLPATLGFAWARRSVEQWQQNIAECCYANDDFVWQLWKLENRGTTCSFVIWWRPKQ